jgi:hypothetical protein
VQRSDGAEPARVRTWYAPGKARIGHHGRGTPRSATGSGYPGLGADAVPAIVSLDGEEQAAIAFEIADAEASMDAMVAAAIEAAETGTTPA